VSSNNRVRAFLYGTVAGAFLALVTFAVFGGRFALRAAVATPIAEGSSRAHLDFAASSGALFLIVIVGAVLGGLAVAGITYAAAREGEPDAPKFPLRYQLPIAAGVAAITAYAVVRAGIGGFGDITMGIVTVSVFRMALIVVVAGATAGATTGYLVDRLARPELLGLGGVAWESHRAVLASMTRAVGIPLMAVVGAGGFAIALAQLLLGAENIDIAVILFSVAGAVVLGGITLLAYRPWDRDGGGQPNA
jgi:hypothetical protein